MPSNSRTRSAARRASRPAASRWARCRRSPSRSSAGCSREMRERHPAVSLKVLEGSSGQVEEWLADARVDIAILYRYGPTLPETEQSLAVVDSYLIGAAGRPADGRAGGRLRRAARAAVHPAQRAERPAHGARCDGAPAAHHAGAGDRGRLAAAAEVAGRDGAALHRAAAARGLDRGARTAACRPPGSSTRRSSAPSRWRCPSRRDPPGRSRRSHRRSSRSSTTWRAPACGGRPRLP